LRTDILTEEQIKFASACIIQLLNYLREKQIIHRDIMMKNIIMDKNKYFNTFSSPKINNKFT
jgi:serine/threonine protein kinase